MLIVTTLGFTESFALRGLLKRGIKEKDKVIVVRPSDEVERAVQALEALAMTLEKLGYQRPIEVKVDVGDFEGSVAKIAARLQELFDGEGIYANLSGGMRLLILEVLLGIIHSGIKAEIEVFSEDGKVSVTFTPSVFQRPKVRRDELEVLWAFSRTFSVTEASQLISYPKSNVSRKLKNLRDMGLIEGDRLTTLGKIYLKYYELTRKAQAFRPQEEEQG